MALRFKFACSYGVGVFFLLAGTTNMFGQGDCNLIESVTLNVPPNDQVTHKARLERLTGYQCDIAMDQWNYIAWTKTADNQGTIYRNGQPVFSGNFEDQAYNFSSIDLGITNWITLHYYFDGQIDELRISNIVRSNAEIYSAYASNQPFSNDSHTIGLWHFDQSSGTTVMATAGVDGAAYNQSWTAGRFGNCLDFNGTSTRAHIPMSVPTSNITVEFWVHPRTHPYTPSYPPGEPTGVDRGMVVQLYG